MPIRPENKHRYPSNWKSISLRIRRHRAGNRCECTGECGSHRCLAPKVGFCGAANKEPHPVTESIVVLTVAHLDHTPENIQPSNLRAYCQLCHLSYDRDLHLANRRRAEIAAGQDALFEST